MKNIKKHKTHILIIFFILIISTIFSKSCLAADPNFTDSKQSLYVALGDSITAGTGQDSYETAFPFLFSKKIQMEDACVNTGKNGLCIDDLLKETESGNYDQYLKKASYISVTIGGNDILNLITSTADSFHIKNIKDAKKIPTEVKNKKLIRLLRRYLNSPQAQKKLSQFASQMKEKYQLLINVLRSKNPNATILFQTIYNPTSGSEYDDIADCIDTIESPVNEIILNLSNKNERIFTVDIYKEFHHQATKYIRILEQDIHPTKAGHEKIAECLYQTISNDDSLQKNENTDDKDVYGNAVISQNHPVRKTTSTAHEVEKNYHTSVSQVLIFLFLIGIIYILFLSKQQKK